MMTEPLQDGQLEGQASPVTGGKVSSEVEDTGSNIQGGSGRNGWKKSLLGIQIKVAAAKR